MSVHSPNHGRFTPFMRLTAVILILLNMAMFDTSCAQSTASISNQHTNAGKRFRLMLGGSQVWTVASQWSDQIESSLVSAGLDETVPGGYSLLFGYFEPQETPATKSLFSQSVWLVTDIEVAKHYELRGRFAFRGELGNTRGYCFDSYDTISFSYQIIVKPTVMCLSVSLMYELRDGLRLGFGPALTLTKIDYETFAVSHHPNDIVNIREEMSKTLFGAVFEIAYRRSLSSRFFAEAGALYVVTTEASLGPIDLTHPYDTIGRRLPETDLNFNWGQIGAGIGIAF